MLFADRGYDHDKYRRLLRHEDSRYLCAAGWTVPAAWADHLLTFVGIAVP